MRKAKYMAFMQAFSFSFAKKKELGDVMEVKHDDLEDSDGEADP